MTTKKIITLFFCWPARICQAQKIDSAGRLATAYFKEAEIAAKDQKLGHAKVYGPMLFVDQRSSNAYNPAAFIDKKTLNLYHKTQFSASCN